MMTGQFIGGAAIFAEAAGIDPVLGLLLFGLLTVFYTPRRLRAVAWTDFVCAVLMIVHGDAGVGRHRGRLAD